MNCPAKFMHKVHSTVVTLRIQGETNDQFVVLFIHSAAGPILYQDHGEPDDLVSYLRWKPLRCAYSRRTRRRRLELVAFKLFVSAR